MYVHFNKQKLHVQVVVGTEEEYKPTEEIKQISKLVSELNDKVSKFREEQVQPEIAKIEALIKDVNPSEVSEER